MKFKDMPYQRVDFEQVEKEMKELTPFSLQILPQKR